MKTTNGGRRPVASHAERHRTGHSHAAPKSLALCHLSCRTLLGTAARPVHPQPTPGWQRASLGSGVSGDPRLSQITEIEPVSLLGGCCKVSFLMGRCCRSRWIGVNERTLKCSRPMPTVSSCPDSCMPCLMVGNYALGGLPEENND